MTHEMLKAAQDMADTGHFQLNRNLWTNVFPGISHSKLDFFYVFHIDFRDNFFLINFIKPFSR